MNERKIIQIATSVSDTRTSLYALCNDGTLWLAVHSLTNPEWRQIADVPASTMQLQQKKKGSNAPGDQL